MDVFNGEREVLRDPAIRVETTSPADRLDPNARINYASVYQLDQDNMSIYVYGRVDPNQLGQFLYNQQEVQRNLRSQATSLTAPSSGTNSQNPPPTTIPPTSGSYSSLQSQTSQQSHGRQAPGRQQSVSNTPARAPQPNQQTQPGPSTSRRAESSGADQRNIRNQAPSVSSITEQMSTLRIRARNYRVDLSRLSHEQQETLSRQPRENQSQYLLQMLRAQNPAVHAQVTQAIASRQNQRRPEEEDEDEDDSDEE